MSSEQTGISAKCFPRCFFRGNSPLSSFWVVYPLIGFIILSIAGCATHKKGSSGSPLPDQVVSARSSEEVKKLQEAMEPYIHKARQTYAEAKNRFLKGLPQGHHFFVTIPITDQEGKTEQVFVFVSSIEERIIRGRIASEITLISGYSWGDAYEIHENQILDWTIRMPDGSEEGNYVGKFLDTYPRRNQDSRLETRTRDTPPALSELSDITTRGKLLAEYTRAVRHAISVLGSVVLSDEIAKQPIAWKSNGRWHVVFGRLSETKEDFLILGEATQQESGGSFEDVHHPPERDTGVIFRAARAIETAWNEFTEGIILLRPYDSMVLPAFEDRLWVYFVPAPTKPNAWPLGGDARYLISSDGTTIIEKRRLHNTVLEGVLPINATSSVHTAVMDDIPEDTDVFHVLIRGPAVPQLIVTRKFAYRVNVNGSIDYLGTREAVRKRTKKK